MTAYMRVHVTTSENDLLQIFLEILVLQLAWNCKRCWEWLSHLAATPLIVCVVFSLPLLVWWEWGGRGGGSRGRRGENWGWGLLQFEVVLTYHSCPSIFLLPATSQWQSVLLIHDVPCGYHGGICVPFLSSSVVISTSSFHLLSVALPLAFPQNWLLISPKTKVFQNILSDFFYFFLFVFLF